MNVSRATLPAPAESAKSSTYGLNLVTAQELRDLESALQKGHIPTDFESKLNRLAGQTLLHQSVEHNCRLFIALLEAVNEGLFSINGGQKERLLRVLAYVRKDDDAVPDYKPNGFADDQREVRAATIELAILLDSFKSWRLLKQVPGLWNSATHGTSKFAVSGR